MSRDKLLPETVMAEWEAVVEEADGLAAEYEDDGWDAVVVHPGDVTAVLGEDYRFDVLAPGSEYQRVQEAVAEHDFDRSHVYRETSGDVAFFLTVFEADATEVVVLVPTYVEIPEFDRLMDLARSDGAVPIHVRPLSDDERVSFAVDDPTLFVPE